MASGRRSPALFRCLASAGLLLALLILSACSPQEQRAAWNVVDYRLRKAFPPLLVQPGDGETASFSGVIRDVAGQPIADAFALVATARGQVYQTRSDSRGRYALDHVSPGRYVPLAAAWGYDETAGSALNLAPGQSLAAVDFNLPVHVAEPLQPTDLRIGPARQSASQFPTPMIATRYPFTFTLDGLSIDTGQLYLPDGARSALAGGFAQTGPGLPTLVIVYPSPPINWDPASVALTGNGFAVLAVGPDGDRGLDIEGHVRDFRAVLQLWQAGQLSPLGRTDGRWVAMSGSFGSLILFRALQDLPADAGPRALVAVGAISDAFLGVQSLYADREALAIPPPYDSAVAAMGRPDRDPAFFFAYSPAFYAEHLPNTLILHSYNDEVIPHNQAQALADALAAAGVPHDLLLYSDTTHYLDARYPTEATFMVYERVLDFVETTLLENLAFACAGCNTYKGAKPEAPDPITGDPARLFHPRRQLWHDHFRWNVDFTRVEGTTPCGRAAVAALKLNRLQLVSLHPRTQPDFPDFPALGIIPTALDNQTRYNRN